MGGKKRTRKRRGEDEGRRQRERSCPGKGLQLTQHGSDASQRQERQFPLLIQNLRLVQELRVRMWQI